jgi:YD repeat-containing protein
MGRIVTHINATGLSTKTCYGFGPARSSIEESRASGYLQLTILDVMGREIKVVDNEDPTQPLSAEANRVLETKEYDCLSRMVQSTDILMLTTNYTYDALSRLINVIDPKGNITSYQSIRGW